MKKPIDPEQLQKLASDGVKPLAIAERLAPRTVYAHIAKLRASGLLPQPEPRHKPEPEPSKIGRKRYRWMENWYRRGVADQGEKTAYRANMEA